MIKLFKGELKKIFYSPIIYIILAIFIFALSVCPSIFKPEERTNHLPNLNINTTNVCSIYESFSNYKSEYDNKIVNANNSIINLINDNEQSPQIFNLANELFEERTKFSNAVKREIIDGEQGCFNLQLKMLEKINNIDTLYSDYKTNYIFPIVLANEKLDFYLTNELINAKRLIDSSSGNKTIEYYQSLETTLAQSGTITKIQNYVNELRFLQYSLTDLLNVSNKYFTFRQEYRQNIYQNMQELYESAQANAEINSSKSQIQQMTNYLYHYLSSCLYNSNTLELSTKLVLTQNYQNEYLLKFAGFNDVNLYQIRESLTQNEYMLTKNLIQNDIASTFAFNKNSTEGTNAFDYAYFCLEILTLIIIFFSVIISSIAIAKEHSDGTIKLLATKPYKRHKILSAKIGTTLFISTILILLSSIVALISGFIMYGFSAPTMLLTINATTTISLSSSLVFLIYIASIILKVYIYILISATISTIFRSFVGAICVNSGIFIANNVITFVSNGANWLKFNIFTHFDLFKYFGGSFLNTNTSISLTKFFYSPVFAGTNIFLSLIIIVSAIIILNIISYSIFNKKDIA